MADGATQIADGNSLIAGGTGEMKAKTSGLTPTVMPWIFGALIAGLIAGSLWAAHRISHRNRVREYTAA